MTLAHKIITRRIALATMQATQLTVSDLTATTQHPSVCDPRVAVWLAMRNAGVPVKSIADCFGRERSTVSKGITKARALLKSDPSFRALYETITNDHQK